MFDEYTLEAQLEHIVFNKIKQGVFPERTPLVSDEIYTKELSDLTQNRIPRPKTKQEYFSRLEYLKTQISNIRSQNDQILLNNESARKAVVDKYISDIEKAKLDEANIGQALCNCINYQLNQTTWYVVKDSQLTPAKQLQADIWRDSIMKIPTDYPKINDAIARYESLTAAKPDIDIKWIEAKP